MYLLLLCWRRKTLGAEKKIKNTRKDNCRSFFIQTYQKGLFYFIFCFFGLKSFQVNHSFIALFSMCTAALFWIVSEVFKLTLPSQQELPWNLGGRSGRTSKQNRWLFFSFPLVKRSKIRTGKLLWNNHLSEGGIALSRWDLLTKNVPVKSVKNSLQLQQNLPTFNCRWLALNVADISW